MMLRSFRTQRHIRRQGPLASSSCINAAKPKHLQPEKSLLVQIIHRKNVHLPSVPRIHHPEIILGSSLLTIQPSSESPTVWLAIAALVGLPTVLWAYKCLMMVIFQRKIIYMGYAPPGARTEELGSDVPVPQGVHVKEIQLQSEGTVKLSGIITRPEYWARRDTPPETVLVYLQGNAGNPLGRLPVFEKLFHGLSSRSISRPHPAWNVAVAAVAPRSYWKSSSRSPTERGLLADYRSVISYTTERFPSSAVILYGHSLGGAIAVCLAAQLRGSDFPNIRGLVLENPFGSIPDMVEALYPQRWLPYRYLSPLTFDKWDAVTAARKMRDNPGSLLERLSRNVLILLSEKDEMVPPTMGKTIFEATEDATQRDDMPRRCVIIKDALHEDAWVRRQWLTEMCDYIGSMRQQKVRGNDGHGR